MDNKFFRKLLIFIVTTLFIIGAFLPVINGELSWIETQETLIKNQETYPFTFYIFDKTGSKECQVDLSVDIGEEINEQLEMLKYQIIIDPLSEKTKVLKHGFVETIDIYGLIPDGMSKDDVLKLLNPSWLSLFNKKIHTTFKEALVRIVKSRFNYPFLKYDNVAFSSDWNILCNIGSVGAGVPVPLFMLPRPRGLALWFSSAGVTETSSLLTGKNFVARGKQQGLAVGFYGVGLTGSFYGMTGYIFTGYASYTMMQAEDFDYFTPPNNEPEILDENPVNGAVDVPLSLSELSFRISDADGDRMSYSVVTSPDIGSGSGMFKKNGVYKIPISGLENNRGYSWSVEVSDRKDTIVKEFSFSTELLPFNPFEDGWQYRKKITINHDMVTGDLTDFPVLVRRVDSDLKSKAQGDGDDILFMDNIGVANKLFHEIEKFDISSGELVAWVKIPYLTSSTDTILYMYYGNPSCNSQQFPENVWDLDYIHVWHLGNNLVDSAGTDDGTNHGTSIVSGKIGNARDFERDNGDYIDLGDMIQPGDGSLTTITWEAWIKPETHDTVLTTKYNSQGTDYSSYYIVFLPGGYFRNTAYSVWNSATNSITINSYSVVGQWIYLTSTFTLGGINDIVPFINGNEVADTQLTSIGNNMCNIPVTDDIGRYRPESGTEYADCVIDEMRWSKIVRSDDWIKTSYNTMNYPSSFFSVGPEESHKPSKPTITGPTNFPPNTYKEFEFNSSDPYDDQIYYYIKWGDGNIIDWQ